MRSGTKYLRVASVIQIILGAASILLTHYLVGNGDVSIAGISAPEALGALILAYGMAVFQILAGLIGLMMADKKSLFTVFLGILLFLPQLVHFFNIKGNIGMILVNVVALAIPYLYLHNAWKNYRDN